MTNTLSVKSRWPTVIVGSFIALALFDAGIVTLAIQNPATAIDSAPYESGLEYQKVIDARRLARHDAIIPKLSYHASLLTIEAKGLSQDTTWIVDLHLLRPDASFKDLYFRTDGVGPLFQVPTEPIESGLWLVDLRIHSKEKEYGFDPIKIVISQ